MAVRRLTATLAGIAVLALAGCGSTTDLQNPVGIGTGPNSLKQSPCACMALPNAADDPGFITPAV